MVLGPHQPFGNAARNIEHTVEATVKTLSICRRQMLYMPGCNGESCGSLDTTM